MRLTRPSRTQERLDVLTMLCRKQSCRFLVVAEPQIRNYSQTSKLKQERRKMMPSSNSFHRIDDEHKQIVEKYISVRPVPLGAIARDLGLNVKISALERGQSGLIEYRDGAYTIKINRHETRERQRFTLAHEIAHFLLHHDIIATTGQIADNVLYRSGQSEQIEYEANRLAADLIMPNDLLFSDLSEMGVPVTDEVIERLAQEWQVSKAAMEIRLSSYAA